MKDSPFNNWHIQYKNMSDRWLTVEAFENGEEAVLRARKLSEFGTYRVITVWYQIEWTKDAD